MPIIDSCKSSLPSLIISLIPPGFQREPLRELPAVLGGRGLLLPAALPAGPGRTVPALRLPELLRVPGARPVRQDRRRRQLLRMPHRVPARPIRLVLT